MTNRFRVASTLAGKLVQLGVLLRTCCAWRASRPVCPGASGSREMHEAHFGCPAKLHARQNTIVFAKADLDRPFLTHNADLFATVAPQLEAEWRARHSRSRPRPVARAV